MDAVSLFDDAVSWLKENYSGFRFFLERDIVWTVQAHIITRIETENLEYRIYHNFPMLPGKTVDLAILRQDNSVALAAEFKYEPSHDRKFKEFLPNKLPVVFWDEGVGKDILRIQEFVDRGKADMAYMLFIDEGGYFRWREAFAGSQWIDWGRGISVLSAKAGRL